jgi:3-oxoacyl-[acyl-carrier-protein] synthase III
MRVGDMYINSLGTWQPEVHSTEQAVREGRYDAADLAETGLTGVMVAGPDVAPADMAVWAVQDAIARLGGVAPEVDLVLYASSSWPQGPAGWPVPSYVQRRTVGGTAPAWDVQVGCNGGFAALQIACCHLRAAAEHKAVLFAAGDNWSSPKVDRWRSTPGTLLADVASALVLSRTPGFARVLSINMAGVPDLEGMHRGVEPLHPGADELRPVLDLGARVVEFRDSGVAIAEAQILAAKVQAELVDKTLSEAGVRIEDISRVAYVHCARYMIQQWLLDPLNLPLSRSTWDFGRAIGHSGPSDHIIALDHLLATGQLVPGDRVLLVGLAPGMSLASAVVEIVDRPAWLPERG